MLPGASMSRACHEHASYHDKSRQWWRAVILYRKSAKILHAVGENRLSEGGTRRTILMRLHYLHFQNQCIETSKISAANRENEGQSFTTIEFVRWRFMPSIVIILHIYRRAGIVLIFYRGKLYAGLWLISVRRRGRDFGVRMRRHTAVATRLRWGARFRRRTAKFL